MSRKKKGNGISLAEYAKYDGLGLAELVRKKEVSPAELVDTALKGIEKLNPKINAVCQLYDDEAREEAKGPLPKGPFTGVPFLVKDLGLQMKGKRCDSGSRLAQGVVATHDTELMVRFRKAGLITMGKTTTPELGAHIATEPVLTGITRNPWDLNRSSGGSSGGSAACVAAGILPVAHANDGLGSIRAPAGMCGLYGLKPSRQRIPTGPDAGETSGGRAVEFVVSWSVRDSAAMLDAVHGSDPGAPHCAPAPVRPYMEEISAKPRKLKIAFMTRTFQGNKVHPDCEAAVLKTVKLCEELGHIVEERTPALDWNTYFNSVTTAAMATASAGISMTAEALGRIPSPDNLEPFTWMIYQKGLQVTSLDYQKAMAGFTKTQRTMGRFHEDYDILITPLLAKPPALIGELTKLPKTFEEGWNILASDEYAPFFGFCNVTGQPAASIPLYVSKEGLPIGTQLVAKLGDEGSILALSAQLEAASPWAGNIPPNHVSKV